MSALSNHLFNFFFNDLVNKVSYLYVFIQSNCLEWPVYLLAYHGFHKRGAEKRSITATLSIVTVANLVSHPIVFFGFMASNLAYIYAILLAELFAIGIECALHAYTLPASYKRTLIASIFANLVSWQLGPVLTYYLMTSLN